VAVGPCWTNNRHLKRPVATIGRDWPSYIREYGYLNWNTYKEIVVLSFEIEFWDMIDLKMEMVDKRSTDAHMAQDCLRHLDITAWSHCWSLRKRICRPVSNNWTSRDWLVSQRDMVSSLTRTNSEEQTTYPLLALYDFITKETRLHIFKGSLLLPNLLQLSEIGTCRLHSL